MNALDLWLSRATRHLSGDAAAQVRREIGEHYASARAAAALTAATAEEADRIAVTALGDPKLANCQYREVLLTASEARLLREGDWEAKAICSRAWLRWTFLGLAAATLVAACGFFVRQEPYLGSALLAGSMSVGLLFAAKVLPIDTPERGRVFRGVRLILLVTTVGFAFAPDVLPWSWLLVSCLGPIMWNEWRRISIRRKLPIAQWPRHLYL
jgi:hypothetical protein